MRDVQLIYWVPAGLTVITGFFLGMISLIKGWRQGENLFFSVVCLLWSLSSVFYFAHKSGGAEWAVPLERLHHALHVWTPLVCLHFFYRWLDLRNRTVERWVLFATLVLFFGSLTPWYVQGVHYYDWGIVSDVGSFFYVSVIFFGVIVVYLVRLCQRRMALALSDEEHRTLMLVSCSMAGAGVLSALNLFAFEGVDFYTPGNFLFVPMLGLAYAVFRYRMINMTTILHLSLGWAGVLALFLVPNVGLLYCLHPYLKTLPSMGLFLFFLGWFYLNYRYSIIIQPVIDRVFSRQRFDLKKVESLFSENILLLRRTDEMINEFRRTVEVTLHIRGLVFFTRKGEGFLEEQTGRALELSDATHHWLSLLQVPLDRREVERRAKSREVRREVAALFEQCGCAYIVSLSRYGELLGLVLFHEKGDHSVLTVREERFISRIKEFVSIALYNSTVYQNLRRLQEELSRHTDALVEEAAERKWAQEVAEQSEKRYRFLADNVMDTIGVLSIDPLEFTYLSPSVVKHLGYEAHELVGQDARLVLTEYSDREIRAVLSHAISPGRGTFLDRDAFIYETELQRKDGSRVWSEISARFLRDEELKAREVLLVSRDITERRHLDREREVLQRKLRQAQKMESIGVLAGGIAHDFNNILMAIMGYTQLALMYISDDNPKARDKMMQIDRAGIRARDLVAQILAFSRQNEQKRDTCYLRELLQDTTGFLSASLPSNIDVRFIAGQGKLRVVADAVQIHQIIINLATNAFHAIGDEGGEIRIHADEVMVGEALAVALHLPEGCYVRLSVSDSGHGVDPEIASRIFEPYYTTKEVGKGTGMGLAVVHGIVLNHGGAVSLDSEREKGSTFHVYLPLVSVSSENGEVRDLLGAKGTVLLVDEEAILIDLAREVLGRLGYQVEAFTDGQKALEVFAQWPKKYVAVVIDLYIRGESSASLLHVIRSHAPGTRVVVTSGRPMAQIEPIIHGLDASVLRKPFTLKELAETLERPHAEAVPMDGHKNG